MNLNPIQRVICDHIDRERGKLLDVSHAIHTHPEIGYQEYFAFDLLTRTLKEYGFEVTGPYAGMETAFIGRKRGKNDRPRVAFLAEYDALPVIGHGCGHNIISTTALAAGVGLGAVIEQIEGEVVVIGTPAEETDGAKVNMVREGVFNTVDAALMIHPYTGNYYLTEALALDAIQVSFKGKPAHAAATPWLGRNALDAMIMLFNNINALRQQLRPDARIQGIITNGGAAANIIPDFTSANFNVRARYRAYLNEMIEKFKACAEGAALATGTQAEVRNYENSYDEMQNNEPMALRFKAYMEQALGAELFDRAPSAFGSIDMANVSKVTPGIHPLIKVTDNADIGLHTIEFQQAACTTMADDAILRAAKGLALTAHDFLTDAEFRTQVVENFKTGK